MKYLVQFLTLMLPLLGWIIASLVSNQIQYSHIDRFITIIKLLMFIALALLHFMVYVHLLWREFHRRRVCYTVAQFCVILGVAVFCIFAWVTWQWLDVLSTKQYSEVLNIMYGFGDMLLCVYGVFVCQFIMMTMLSKTVIPFWDVKPKKPFGSYLLGLGVAQELIDKAAELQQRDREK